MPVVSSVSSRSANVVWSREYVLAARAAGKGAWRITIEHVLPNIASVLIVQATIRFAIAILAEAALSYLGLGTQPPTPSWGEMLRTGKSYLHEAPTYAVLPGLALTLTILSLDTLGRTLARVLEDRREIAVETAEREPR